MRSRSILPRRWTDFGLFPVLQALRVDPLAAFRGEGGRYGTAGRGRSRVRAVLVVAELALAVVLLAGAGLLIRASGACMQVDAGFKAGGRPQGGIPASGPALSRRLQTVAGLQGGPRFNDALLRRARRCLVSIVWPSPAPIRWIPDSTNSFVIVGREAEAKTWPEMIPSGA